MLLRPDHFIAGASLAQQTPQLVEATLTALREVMVWDRPTGVPVNNIYHGAKPIMHLEAPETEVIFIETDDPEGPFGAKGVGEPGMVPTAPVSASGKVCKSWNSALPPPHLR